MQPFLRAVSSAWFTIGQLSKPTFKYIKDKQQYELAHTRNKSLVGLHIFAFIQFTLNLLLGNGDKAPNIHGMIGTSGIIAVLFITSYYQMHPQVFKTLFNIYVLTFAVLLINHHEHGIFGAWLAVPIYPIQLYFLTGSLGHFVINISCHTILMNTYYQNLMKNSLAYMSLDETMKALTHYSNQSMSYSLLYTAFSHLTIQTAVYKIQAAEKQKDDLERQRNFLLGFSHELRNLINSLMGNVKLASLESLSEKVKDLLVNAEVCSELLLHLVNNILDTGKVEIGDLEINPVPTKVYDTIERIWSVCSELIKTKNLNGQLKIQRDIPPALVLDHYRITQIFLNLIGNAVKFTDSGHINISVEWINDKKAVDDKCFEPIPFNDANDQDEGLFEKSQALSVFNRNFVFLNSVKKIVNRQTLAEEVCLQKGVLKVSVSDTGSGIIKEDLSSIFQRFQQGKSDPSKKKLGTGLGLFITRELCEKMGGEVRVFSKPGFGSTFIFCLPVEPNNVLDIERVHRNSIDSQHQHQHNHDNNYQKNHTNSNQLKLKAIVVDDEKFSQTILKEFLQKLNVEIVSFANNGLEGYQRYAENLTRESRVNIVTMDINMGVMNGKIAAQKIRELEVEKELEPCLLIMVSGNCGEAEIAECLDKKGVIRANAFVKKPVSVDELCRIITGYSARTQLRHNARIHTI